MDANQALATVDKLYLRLAARREWIRENQDYYEGRHPLRFATPEWQGDNAKRYRGFSDNWTKPVVDAEAERINVTGLVNGSDSITQLWNQWRLNDMEAQSSQGLLESLYASRSYIIVWGDTQTGQPVVTWEPAAEVEIDYDWGNRRTRRAAIKTWIDDDTEFATLYEPDAVWKFQRPRERAVNPLDSQAKQNKERWATSGGWTARLGVDPMWPISNPLGVVPVVEIGNRPLLASDPISEIRGTMAMQDTINLLWAYLLTAADFAALPQRVVLGQAPPMMPVLDNNGQKISERPIRMDDLRKARLAFFTGTNAKIDSWPAADLTGFTNVIEEAVGHVAAQTRTPPHYLVTKQGLSNLSGDALKAAESGLVNKAGEFITQATPGIREAFRLMALVLDDQGLAAQVQLSRVKWADPGIRSDAELSDMLVKKKSIGYPFRYLLELDGVDPADIDRIITMKQQEDAQALAAADPIMAHAMRPLEGGTPDGADVGDGEAAV